MGITGVASFLLLYSLAPILAFLVLPQEEARFTQNEVTSVIRSVSFALILVPVMSLIRGFFQGHGSMGPTAVSQVVEQLARVLFMIVGAYWVIQVMQGSIVSAINIATFAAFIGAIPSLIILIWYWFTRKKHFDKHLLTADIEENTSQQLKQMYKEIIKYAIPFVFVGLTFSLYQFVDQLTFNRVLTSTGLGKEAGHLFAILCMTAPKLVLIPVTLATAFTQSIIPNLTQTYTENKLSLFNYQLNKILQTFLFLIVPSAIGLSLLSDQSYTVFYGHDPSGTNILRVYALSAITMGMFSVTAAIMQSINKQKYTVYSLLVGVSFKICLNIPLIELYQANGAVLATLLGYCTSIGVNFYYIRLFTKFEFKLLFRRSVLIVILAAIMATFIIFTQFTLNNFLNNSRLHCIFILTISTFTGSIIYLYLALKSNLIKKLFGSKFNFGLHRRLLK